jgi:hypothetical protein
VRFEHELWENHDGGGDMVCLAGARGDAARKSLAPVATLVAAFEAGTYFEAMTAYYKLVGWGEYEARDEFEFEPYPEEWARE